LKNGRSAAGIIHMEGSDATIRFVIDARKTVNGVTWALRVPRSVSWIVSGSNAEFFVVIARFALPWENKRNVMYICGLINVHLREIKRLSRRTQKRIHTSINAHLYKVIRGNNNSTWKNDVVLTVLLSVLFFLIKNKFINSVIKYR